MRRAQHDSEILSEDALDRILQTLPAPDRRATLEVIARGYLELARKRSIGTGRGTRADLKRLVSTTQAARAAVDALGIDAWAALSAVAHVTSNSVHIIHLKTITGQLRALEQTATKTLKWVQKLPSDRTPDELVLTVGLLSVVYRRATGRPVTHTSNIDGEYSGEARSPFGRFVTSFFKEVDPDVPQRQLANIIRRDRQWLNEQPLD